MFLNNKKFVWGLVGFILMNPVSGVVAQDREGAIPVKTFLRPDKLKNVKISPDGRYVAGNSPMDDGTQQGLVVIDLDGMEVQRTIKLNPGQDIGPHYWVRPDEIVFQTIKWNYFTAGFFGTNVEEKTVRPLVRNDAVVHMVDPMRDDAEQAWVEVDSRYDLGLMKLEKSGYARVREGLHSTIPDIRKNPLLSSLIDNPEGQTLKWYTDWDHRVRLVARYHEGTVEVLHRENAEDDWKALPLDFEKWDLINVKPGQGHVFTSDNRGIYLEGYGGEETTGLYVYDIQSGELSEAQFRDPEFDFNGTAAYKFYKKNLIGLNYEQDVPTDVWFFAQMQKIQDRIDGILPKRINTIQGWSEDFKRHLISSYSDVVPAEYYLLDLEKGEIIEISKSAPWLDYDSLARTQIFRFKTSDGLRLQGYLTIPKKGKAPYPMVSIVHGGPWSRDRGIYQKNLQLLANRGYAVLRVNFRGSTGFGNEISRKHGFNLKGMHRDITEAVNTVIEHGIADPDRVAIMGASFGGYAAVCGVALEPDLYRCAIAKSGAYDFERLVHSFGRRDNNFARDLWQKKMVQGNLLTVEDFNLIFPIEHADQIQVPVFISHGKLDQRVPISQSRKLESALSKYDVAYETYYPAEQRHSIYQQEERLEYYRRILAFLEKHLGG